MPFPFILWGIGALLLGGLAALCWLDDEDKEEIEEYMVNNGYNTLHKVFMTLSRVGDRIMRWLGLKGTPDAQTTQTHQREVKDPRDLPDAARAAYERIRAQQSRREQVDITGLMLEAIQ